jgi:C4-dicarboxylate transporter DctM subunit
MIDQLNSTTLMALPLFVMAAAFMRRGGVAQALVDLSIAWLGGIKGSLGLVAVVSCALFVAISGSSVATALAMGTILFPAMLERGYPRSFALGVLGASGTIGVVIPPSLALILYGIVTEQSVPRLFLAGILPGLLQAGAFFLWVLYYARRKGFPAEPPVHERLRVTWRALPAMAVPVVVLGGIYGGFMTVTESAAMAAVTSLIGRRISRRCLCASPSVPAPTRANAVTGTVCRNLPPLPDVARTDRRTEGSSPAIDRRRKCRDHRS